MASLDAEVRRARLAEQLRFDTPFWAGGAIRDESGSWRLPGPGAFQGCAKILNKQRKLVQIVPNEWQLEFDDKLEAQRAEGKPMRGLVLKSRKLGFSSWVALKFIQRVTQMEYQQAIVVAQDVATAKQIFNMAILCHSHLPDVEELGVGFSIRPPIVKQNFSATGRSFVEFGEATRRLRMNGRMGNSVFEIDTANAPEGGRGFTPNLLHASEVAKWKGEAASKKLLSSLNSVAYEPETIVVLESTADGLNHFYRRWINARDGAGDPDSGETYVAMFVPWWRDRSAAMPFATVEDRERFVETIGDTNRYGEVVEDEQMLMESFACTPEQLMWRRMMIKTQHENNLEMFRQEFPACVTFETRVSTEQGIIEVGRADTASCTESGPVAHWWPQVASPIWRLTTKQGRVLRGTADHPIQTADGAIWLAELERGAKIELRPPRFAAEQCVLRWDGPLGLKHTLPINERLGRWLGYFMGDGSWHRGTLSFALDRKDGDVVDDVASLTTDLIASPHRRVIARVRGRKGMIELRVGAMPAELLMRRLGCVAPAPSGGRLRREVCVPDVIWRSPRRVVREFLRALFECDGSASGGRVRWGSSKIQFARDVQLLLLGFGLNAVMSATEKTAGNGNAYRFYALQLGGDAARAFHDRIGFISERKRSARPAKPETAAGRWCVGLRMEDEVLSVERDGEEVTYDFTIDNDEHLFMANGILTHNTDEEAFIGSGRTVFSSILVSRAIKGAEEAPPPVLGSLRPVDPVERRSRAGSVLVPQRAVWLPQEAMTVEDHLLKVWEHPRKRDGEWPESVPVEERVDGAYIVAADIASGESDTFTKGDFHAIQVFDHRTLAQVAVHESRMEKELLPLWLLSIALYYNNAWLAVEVNGPGIAVVDPLQKTYRYRHMYRRKRIDRVREVTEDKPGWSTDQISKPVMETTLATALQEGNGGIRDIRTARQLSTYIITEKGKHEAQHGEHDDLLVATMIAHRLMEVLRPPRVGKRVRRNRHEPADPLTNW